MTESRLGGVLHPQNTKGFVEEFRKSLADKMARVESAEALMLLNGVREELLKELSAGKSISAEIEKLIEKLAVIHVADELKEARESFLKLVAELYNMRSSVDSTFSLAKSFYDRLIATAFDHALKLLKAEGRKTAPLTFALLVSGELGRGESILGSSSRFFFIYQEPDEADRDFINELATNFMALLAECFPNISRSQNKPATYWFGSDAEWTKTAAELLTADDSGSRSKPWGKSLALFMETASDMRVVCGDPDFSQSIITICSELLADCVQKERFRRYARDMASMPVPIGVFGRFKTVKTGKNKGKIDLKEMAIDPLTAAIRILSLVCGKHEPASTDRIKSIVATGDMEVALANRLLIAYQDFMREKIRLELTNGSGLDGLFFNPEDLNEEARERFRGGFDSVIALQKIVHQHLAEVNPG